MGWNEKLLSLRAAASIVRVSVCVCVYPALYLFWCRFPLPALSNVWCPASAFPSSLLEMQFRGITYIHNPPLT